MGKRRLDEVYDRPVDCKEAARRWAETWERAWPAKDVEAIAGLYAEDAAYRSHPLRDPHPGGAAAYVRWAFEQEDDLRCWFGEPVAGGDRAAVEWWAALREEGRDVTLIGTTVLRFSPDGLVVDHRDYWLMDDGRREPYAGWRDLTKDARTGHADGSPPDVSS